MAVTESCVCGHLKTDHPEAECLGQSNLCECPAYVELCSICRHSSEVHANGRCLRIVRKTMQPCGCGRYPVGS